jgi:hypothetical protein
MTQAANQTQTPDHIAALFINRLATQHRGRSNGIKGEHLAASCGMTLRFMRSIISKAREQGVLISGTPETGYYIATTQAEVDEYTDFLTHRALHSLALVARAKKISLPVFMGQLNLGT